MASCFCFPPNKISIKILVDEVRNKVLFVQAGKDFVDVLLSFLTLPLGTIARLVSQESNMNNVNVGSLSSLYESVTNLDKEMFTSPLEKELVVRPINSMENYCRYLKLNIDDTENLRSFSCGDFYCKRRFLERREKECKVKTNNRRICECSYNKRVELCDTALPANKGFVPKSATFIVSDDFDVKPDHSQNSVSLPKYLGCQEINDIKIVTMNVTRNEILDLVKCSLLSETPLTDVFLSKILYLENTKAINMLDLDYDHKKKISLVRKPIEIKAMVRKSDKKILYALGEEDFGDLLLLFLTFPLGGVENMLNSNTGIDNIDNLYKSMCDLDSRYLRSTDLLAKHEKFEVGPNIIVNSPSTFMVTDDLVVTPGSSTAAISFLTENRIPPSDLEEREIIIDNKGALSLLKASLISTSALTIGLGPFLTNKDSEKISK